MSQAPIFDVNDNVFLQDPAQVIQSILAYPDRYFTDDFDIAVRDGVRQATIDNGTVAQQSLVGPPLLLEAISTPGTQEWLLHRFFEGLHAVLPSFVNSIYPHSVRMLEPPLHLAVRVGRHDVVGLILHHGGADLSTRFVQEHFYNDYHCERAGSAHLPPCEPNNVEHACLTALEYAIHHFGLSPEGSVLRQNIEECALEFVNAGSFEAPLDNDSQVVLSFAEAIAVGMNRYVLAVLTRIFQAPQGDVNRNYLENHGVERILYEAAGAMESNPLIQQILDLSIQQGVFPLPRHPETLGINPIEAALEQNFPRNACTIWNNRANCLPLPQDQAQWTRRAMRNTDMRTLAACNDANQEFFQLLLNEVNPAPEDNDEGIIERKRIHRRILGRKAMRAGKIAIRNTELSLTGGNFIDAFWLRAALEYKNDGALMFMIANWPNHLPAIGEPQAQVTMWMDVPPSEDGWSALNYAVITRYIIGIELLLNAGADPQSVIEAEWRELADEMQECLDTDVETHELAKRYYRYGFSLRDRFVVDDDELNANQSIREHFRLVYRVARLYYGATWEEASAVSKKQG